MLGQVHDLKHRCGAAVRSEAARDGQRPHPARTELPECLPALRVRSGKPFAADCAQCSKQRLGDNRACCLPGLSAGCQGRPSAADCVQCSKLSAKAGRRPALLRAFPAGCLWVHWHAMSPIQQQVWSQFVEERQHVGVTAEVISHAVPCNGHVQVQYRPLQQLATREPENCNALT